MQTVTSRNDAGSGSGLERNIPLFFVYKGLFGFAMGVATPIMVLYFLAKPLSLTRFMVLMTVMNVAAFASAVPSGIVADKYNRKASMLLGAIGLTLSFFVMLATADFMLLAAAFFVWGVAQSLSVGIETAFFYDSAKAVGREDAFQRMAGTASFVFLGATVAGNAFSGVVVARLGLAAPFWTAAGTIGLCVLAIALLREPPLADAASTAGKSVRISGRFASYGKHLAESLRLVLRSRELVAIAFVQIVILRSFNLANRPFAQPILKGFGFDASAISFLFVGFNIVGAVAAKLAPLADRGGKREGRGYLLMLALLLASLAIFAYGGGSVPAAAAIAGMYLVYGLSGPLLATGLNRRVASAQRATCLSIATMVEAGLAIVTGPLFGGLSDAYSIGTGVKVLLWTFAPLIALGAVLVLLAIRPRRAS